MSGPSAVSHAAPNGTGVGASAPIPSSAIDRVESSLSAALHHLWTSALIVEQGATPVNAAADELDKLMSMVQPRVNHAGLTNQNLQQQLDGYAADLVRVDRAARELTLSVPKNVIECVEAGYNPGLLTAKFIDDAKMRHDAVRAKVFATRVLHDQLLARMNLWNQQLQLDAQQGDQSALILLNSNMDTLKSHSPASTTNGTLSAGVSTTAQ